MSFLRTIATASLALAFPALVGCGPSHVIIDPKTVKSVEVRPSSGQLLFCPGDTFSVEVIAKLDDGSTCSNINGNTGCLKQEDLVIAPELIHIDGRPAQPRGGFAFQPDPDPLNTADIGLTLRAWLQSEQGVKSAEGQAKLKPVYECMQAKVFSGPAGARPGDPGSPGPDLTIAITSLSTPYYPDAALIRVDWGANRNYFISPSSDKPVKLLSKGGMGAKGQAGTPGADGVAGKDAAEECGVGENGTDGALGANGGKGGDGGIGGAIKVLLDEAKADRLKGRLLLASEGGDGGLPGDGGPGGRGGDGGKGGALKAGDPSCKPADGKRGKNGSSGQRGTSGARGPAGPAPVYENGKRDALFGNELGLIQRIEAAKAQ